MIEYAQDLHKIKTASILAHIRKKPQSPIASWETIGNLWLLSEGESIYNGRRSWEVAHFQWMAHACVDTGTP